MSGSLTGNGGKPHFFVHLVSFVAYGIQKFRDNMTAQTGIKAQRSTFLRAYWPLIGALLIAYLGWWLLMREQTSAAVMAIGTAGMLVCLPLFKQQKSPWLYIAAFVLCSTGTLVDAKYLTDAMGLEWLPRRTAAMISLSVQGFVASFAYILLHLYVFRLKGRAELLVKIPLCILFMIAALYPAVALCWLFLAAIGLAPLC